MRNMKGVVLSSILLIALGLSSNLLACTPDGWSSFSMVGNAENGDTGSPLPISRYEEFCAYAVTGTSYVRSIHASDTRYFARFYVFPDVSGTGTVDLLVAYTDDGATTPLFNVSYDGNDFNFDAGGAGGGAATVGAPSGWSIIEIEYDSEGSSMFNYWVNETGILTPSLMQHPRVVSLPVPERFKR